MTKFPPIANPTSWGPKSTYLVAIVVMSCLGVTATLSVFYLRPDKDNATLLASIGGFILPTTMALLAFMKAQETHTIVNSRMDELKEELRRRAVIDIEAAHTEGRTEGHEQGVSEANKRTDAIAKRDTRHKMK